MKNTNYFKTNHTLYHHLLMIIYNRVTGMNEDSTLYYWLVNNIFLVTMIYNGSNVFHTGFESIMEGPPHAFE